MGRPDTIPRVISSRTLLSGSPRDARRSLRIGPRVFIRLGFGQTGWKLVLEIPRKQSRVEKQFNSKENRNRVLFAKSGIAFAFAIAIAY